MVFLNTIVCQHYPPDSLPGAVRSALGKPLRRAAPLTQLALLGALACLSETQRQRPTALLWQSTTGPRLETLGLLAEVCNGDAEPMPYDFLATQPALAAAQAQPFLPGLHSAMHVPLDQADSGHWGLLLSLAVTWLNAGRYEQVLCAQLDHRQEMDSAYWLSLSCVAGENPLASLSLVPPAEQVLADTADLPARLQACLSGTDFTHIALASPAALKLTVEFARL